MSTSVSSINYPTAIEFDCQACTSTLEVPFSFLGASGPCPYCNGTATAPTLTEWEQLNFPPTSAPEHPTGEMRIKRRKRRPAEPERKLEPSPAAEKMLNPDPRSAQRVQGRLDLIKEKFRRSRIARIDDTGPSLPQVLGWLTVALTLVAIGFGLAVAFYTVPLKPTPKQFAMPVNLTEQVIMEKARQGKLRAQAENEAQDAVAQFLHSGTTQGGSLEMFSASGQVADFPQSSFSDLKREELRATTCVRIPGSGDFLITVEPTDERGPVFIVQQQQGKQLLHVDALAQQSGDTLNTFLNAPGEASIVAYVLAMPSQTQLPVEGLEGWSKVDISPAFPGNNPRRFVASARPDGAAAEVLENRTGVLHFNTAVAEFKWSKTSQGKRFIEVVRFIPNAWARF